MVKADHIGGAVFVAAGLSIFAVSGDLPFGSLAFPGAGFMPKVLAALLIIMGALLAASGRDSAGLRELGWADVSHAAAVAAITAAAIYLYRRLGFVITLPLMLFAFLAVVERKRLIPAAVYSVGVTALAYLVFHRLLLAPIPRGPFGF